MKTKLIMLLLTVASITVNAQKLNFTGNWKLNTEKSGFGKIPLRAAPKSYAIVQKDNELSLSWVTEGSDGKDATSTQRLELNGKPASMLLSSDRTRVMIAGLSEDRKTLQLNKSYSKVGKPEEPDYELKEVWSLSADGKQLSIALTSPGYTIKTVYDRVNL